MVSFTVRFTFAPEDRDDVAETLRLVTSESRREPGCVSYIPHHVEGKPDIISDCPAIQGRDRPGRAPGLGALQKVCRRRTAAEDERPQP